jgi:hypothetical protein
MITVLHYSQCQEVENEKALAGQDYRNDRKRIRSECPLDYGVFFKDLAA